MQLKGLTSTMMVAIKRVGSNMRFSCLTGPMRKMVLRGKHTAIQTQTERTRGTWPPRDPRMPMATRVVTSADVEARARHQAPGNTLTGH